MPILRANSRAPRPCMSLHMRSFVIPYTPWFVLYRGTSKAQRRIILHISCLPLRMLMLPETHIKRRYRSRVKTYLDPIREWPGFAAWLDEERKKRQVSIGHIARTLGLGYDGGTSYVRRVLHGKVIATPSTIRKVCKAIGISWPAAFANAGYYEELLAMMV